MNQDTINKLTISGFRGILGLDMTNENASLLAISFSSVLRDHLSKERLNILIARDGRKSGEDIEKYITNSLVDQGDNITVMGVSTTPSVLYVTKTFTFDGAIIITASHNPKEYNGLKFIMNDGHFANKEIIEKIKQTLKNVGSISKPNNTKGAAIFDNTLSTTYINHIVSSFSKLSTKPRVLIDPVNSSGSIMGPEFLRGLGAETIAINDEPIGEFMREPEPNPKALTELGRAVVGYNMDIGFGLDPDGDRLVIVDENGIPVFEEYTIAIAAKAFYEKLKKENAISSAGPLIINMSTSRTVVDIAKEYGVKTLLSPVGEPNVVKKMIEENSMFGGEGSGGVIFRPVNFGRDSFVAMALILNLLEESGKKISEIVSDLPKYIMIKEKLTGINNFKDFIPQIKGLFPEAVINTDDGLRFDFEDSAWVQVRASNTEPIIRIFGEAKNEERIKSIVSQIKAIF